MQREMLQSLIVVAAAFPVMYPTCGNWDTMVKQYARASTTRSHGHQFMCADYLQLL